MRIQNRFISAGFRLIYLAGALYGVLLNLFVPGAEISSVLSFYTMHSNLFCIALTLVLLSCDLADIAYHENRFYTAVRFCAVMCILLTCVIYHAVIRPRMCAEFPEYFGSFSLSDTLLHTYAPVMMLLDYLLFDEKGLFRWWYAPLSLISPILYMIFVAIYSSVGGVFIFYDKVQAVPYFFLDYRVHGTGKTVFWCLLILAGMVVGGILLCALDRTLRRLWKACQARMQRERDVA